MPCGLRGRLLVWQRWDGLAWDTQRKSNACCCSLRYQAFKWSHTCSAQPVTQANKYLKSYDGCSKWFSAGSTVWIRWKRCDPDLP